MKISRSSSLSAYRASQVSSSKSAHSASVPKAWMEVSHGVQAGAGEGLVLVAGLEDGVEVGVSDGVGDMAAGDVGTGAGVAVVDVELPQPATVIMAMAA